MIHIYTNMDNKEWFEKYDQENPRIYEFFKQYSIKSIRRGFQHLSAEFIFNIIRWETSIMANGEEFKVNNNAKPFYARKFMKEHPQYDGFFRKRYSKAD